MKIALVGQRSFGAEALRALNEISTVKQVFAPVGDRLDFEARRLGIETHERLVADALAPRLDLIVCAHAHVFVSEKARARPALGAIGYHPSLLPRHRGRDAVRWTIHMGDPVAGGSVYWLTNHVDGGPIAAADFVHVRPGMTASELWRDHLFPMGVRLLCRVIRDLHEGRMVKAPQDPACATWEPSWDRPPIERPDLLQLTDGNDRVAECFTLVTDRSAA